MSDERSAIEQIESLIHREPSQWTSRYLAYCAAHGVSDPEEMLRLDGERYPGGPMAGFLTWRAA
jgi:hypothetical protein